ncbi:helix-turn-helix domain-containing protein [Leeuwenhoekiella parthenopeia]|uniref:Helix-turn-helix domain-containing protein n=1 Tax=Leeuwenhoekiella parthenopeia TaxID=2890320 RepID=A0ABS8GMT8_9FLAO|nr:helix-turn-helix domain-containing protein [Leeuwenhoekiella parthenopeia]
MYFNIKYCFIIILLISVSLQAQKSNRFERLSEEELLKYYDSTADLDSLQFIANRYLELAKASNDKIKLARGYDLMARVYDTDTNLKYADSIIQVSKNLENHKNYPAIGYLLKGFYYYIKDDFVNALVNFEESEQFILKNDFEKILTYRLGVSAIHKLIGSSSIEFQKRTLQLIEDQDDFELVYYDAFFNICEGIAYSYLDLNDLKNAEFYFLKGQKLVDKLNLDDYESFIFHDRGILAFENQDYDSALDFFNKASVSDFDLSKRITFLIDRANAKQLFGNYAGAKKDFIRADSLFVDSGVFPEQLNDLYSFLICDASDSKNFEMQQVYIDRFIRVQNEEKSRFEELNKYINSKSNSLNHSSAIISKSEFNKAGFVFLLIIATLLLFVLIILFIKRAEVADKFSMLLEGGFLFRGPDPKNKDTSQKVQQAEQVVTYEQKDADSTLDLGIDVVVVKDILKKLDDFEAKKEFIKIGGLRNVSSHLKTNSSYLSKVINAYKKQSFANYIHELRIAEAVNKLKSDTILRSYTIEAISKEFGYSSAESFSKAFKRITNLYPSVFIKNLG